MAISTSTETQTLTHFWGSAVLSCRSTSAWSTWRVGRRGHGEQQIQGAAPDADVRFLERARDRLLVPAPTAAATPWVPSEPILPCGSAEAKLHASAALSTAGFTGLQPAAYSYHAHAAETARVRRDCRNEEEAGVHKEQGQGFLLVKGLRHGGHLPPGVVEQ